MNKMQKQKMLDCIGSLNQAHEEIREALKQNSFVLVQTMISECQNFAISLGETIDKLEGEGHITVSLLEEYCEILFQIYREIEGGEINVDKIYKILKTHLLKIDDSVKNDIHVKMEMVFLPYKASMWDSLESVWKAAQADGDTDVYVIPIPYYNRSQDGSFQEMYYEARMYPDYVPITKYDQYDFEGRRPDVIFIHNPYDKINHVTSVHPFFYAKNLRRFTDKLVYVPYFISGEIDPNNQKAIEGMRHFCFLPGVIYAHKVIVQSENLRRIYINEYAKEARINGLSKEHTDKKFLEKKILGFGSPKIDKVLDINKQELEIPKEWLKVIQKPDGSWKKIVFYNTSISTLLQDSEKMLCKMESVFKFFYENEEDTVLLWRPHPLFENTLMSMRLQLLKKYQTIKDKYIQAAKRNLKDGKPTGLIFDDTAHLHRAIAISDMYFGDGSSVVPLYQKTRKPIIMQNIEETDIKAGNLELDWGIIEGNTLISSFRDYNCFCKVNLATGDADMVFPDLKEPFYAYLQHVVSAKIDSRVFLLPHCSPDFIVYDLCSKAVETFSCPHSYHVNYNLSFGVLKDKIYLKPYLVPAIGIFDLKMNKMDFCNIPLDTGRYEWKDSMHFCCISGCLAGNKMYLLCKNPDTLVEFDCETYKFAFYNEWKDGTSISFDGKEFWIGLNNRTIAKWNKEKSERVILDNLPNAFIASSTEPLGFSQYLDGYIILWSCNSNMILRVNIKNNYIDPLNLPSDKNIDNFDDNSETEWSIIGNDGKYIYLVWHRHNSIIKQFVSNNSYEIIKLNFKSDDLKKLNSMPCEKIFGDVERYDNSCFMTDSNLDWPFILNHLPYVFPNTEKQQNKNAGKQIYEYLKGLVLS